MPVTPIQQRLASLQAHYAERINAAVAAGRMDLVRDLANGYEDEALELILDGERRHIETAGPWDGRVPGVRWRVAALAPPEAHGGSGSGGTEELGPSGTH